LNGKGNRQAVAHANNLVVRGNVYVPTSRGKGKGIPEMNEGCMRREKSNKQETRNIMMIAK